MWHPPVTVFLAGNIFSQNVALRHEKVKIGLPQSFLVNQKWSLKEALVVTGDILRKYMEVKFQLLTPQVTQNLIEHFNFFI